MKQNIYFNTSLSFSLGVQTRLTKTRPVPEVLTNIDSHGKCSECTGNMKLWTMWVCLLLTSIILVPLKTVQSSVSHSISVCSNVTQSEMTSSKLINRTGATQHGKLLMPGVPSAVVGPLCFFNMCEGLSLQRSAAFDT